MVKNLSLFLSIFLVGCANMGQKNISCKVTWSDGRDTVYSCTKEIPPEEIIKQEPKEVPVEPEETEEEEPHYKYKI